MDKKEITLAVIADVSGSSADTLKPEMELVAHLGIDSPNALRLLISLEERLEIEISDEDAARLDTVGDLLEYVETHA